MDLDAVNSLASSKGKRSSSPRDGWFKCGVEHFFNDTPMHPKATASNHLAKANRARGAPRVIAKERVRRESENTKVPMVPKVRTREPRKLVY